MRPITSLNEAEIEEVFSRSSGPGGQNVNKVSTRVTLRHLPTNIIVSVSDSRSQFMNRQLARERLLAALQQREHEAVKTARHQREKLRRQNAKRPGRQRNGFSPPNATAPQLKKTASEEMIEEKSFRASKSASQLHPNKVPFL